MHAEALADALHFALTLHFTDHTLSIIYTAKKNSEKIDSIQRTKLGFVRLVEIEEQEFLFRLAGNRFPLWDATRGGSF